MHYFASRQSHSQTIIPTTFERPTSPSDPPFNTSPQPLNNRPTPHSPFALRPRVLHRLGIVLPLLAVPPLNFARLQPEES